MKQETLNEFILSKLDEMLETCSSKNKDYANEDALSNFRESAEFAGVTPAQSALVLIGTKISRIKNLLRKGGVANNESLQDSLKDLRVYTMLYEAILADYEEIPVIKKDVDYFAIGVSNNE